MNCWNGSELKITKNYHGRNKEMKHNNKRVHFKRVGGYHTSIRKVIYDNETIGIVITGAGKSTFYPLDSSAQYISQKFTDAVEFYFQQKEQHP